MEKDYAHYTKEIDKEQREYIRSYNSPHKSQQKENTTIDLTNSTYEERSRIHPPDRTRTYVPFTERERHPPRLMEVRSPDKNPYDVIKLTDIAQIVSAIPGDEKEPDVESRSSTQDDPSQPASFGDTDTSIELTDPFSIASALGYDKKPKENANDSLPNLQSPSSSSFATPEPISKTVVKESILDNVISRSPSILKTAVSAEPPSDPTRIKPIPQFSRSSLMPIGRTKRPSSESEQPKSPSIPEIPQPSPKHDDTNLKAMPVLVKAPNIPTTTTITASYVPSIEKPAANQTLRFTTQDSTIGSLRPTTSTPNITSSQSLPTNTDKSHLAHSAVTTTLSSHKRAPIPAPLVVPTTSSQKTTKSQYVKLYPISSSTPGLFTTQPVTGTSTKYIQLLTTKASTQASSTIPVSRPDHQYIKSTNPPVLTSVSNLKTQSNPNSPAVRSPNTPNELPRHTTGIKVIRTGVLSPSGTSRIKVVRTAPPDVRLTSGAPTLGAATLGAPNKISVEIQKPHNTAMKPAAVNVNLQVSPNQIQVIDVNKNFKQTPSTIGIRIINATSLSPNNTQWGSPKNQPKSTAFNFQNISANQVLHPNNIARLPPGPPTLSPHIPTETPPILSKASPNQPNAATHPGASPPQLEISSSPPSLTPSQSPTASTTTPGISTQPPLSFKRMKRIRAGGCSRTDGFQPFRRKEAAIMHKNMLSLITSQRQTNDQQLQNVSFPMIKEYKSLATGQSPNSTTNTPTTMPILVNQAQQLNTGNSSTTPLVQTTSNARNDETNRNFPTPGSITATLNSQNASITRKAFIDLTSDDDTGVFLPTTAASTTASNTPLSPDDPNYPRKDFLSDTIERIRQRTSSSSKEIKLKPLLNQATKTRDKTSIELDLETSPIIDTVNSISRTLFALDRFYRQRRFLHKDVPHFAVCVNRLKELSLCLQMEREKQKLFMDSNLNKWKQPAKGKAKETSLTVKSSKSENSSLTPAERLIEKFSLKIRHSSILKSPGTKKKEFHLLSLTKTKSVNPPIISKRTEQKLERRRTFRQVINAYKFRKKQLKKSGKWKSPIKVSPTKIPKQKVVTPTTSTSSKEVKPASITSPKISPIEHKHSKTLLSSDKKKTPITQTLTININSSSNQGTKFDKGKQKAKAATSWSSTKGESCKLKLKTTQCLLKTNSEPQSRGKLVPPLNKKGRPLTLLDSDDDPTSSGASKSSRTRSAPRKFSNPKDPYYTSSDDIELQKALKLSIQTANKERRNKSSGARRERQERSLSPAAKKKKREIEQLTDSYWNESWLKDSVTPPGSARDITSPVSVREERALHYAMARFAEMEQSTPSTSPVSTPREKIPSNTGSTKTSPNEGAKRQRENQATTNQRQRKRLKSANTDGKRTVTSGNQRKGMALLKKARENVAKAKEKKFVTKTASIVLDKLPYDEVKRKLKSNHPVSFAKPGPVPSPSTSDAAKKNLKVEQETGLTPTQKKEYLLVPKYKGFKDFTPIVVNSRTRRSATAEDKDKLKKQNFALMVVEKIGDQTKQVIVADGEDKSKKLAEASEKMQKDFESLSKKKRYLTVSRHTGETVLHKAARLGYAEIAEQGIKEGADVQAKDNAGWTALHEACAYGKKEVAQVLLKYGADPNCCSNSGVRPLHDAAEKGNIAVIRVLLSYGADPSIGTYTGALPIDCTRKESIKQFLREHSVDQSLAKSREDLKETWTFSGSCDALDTNDVNGIFDDIPIQNQSTSIEFQMSSRPLVRSFYLPYLNEKGITVGYKNYFLLSELLERLRCSKNSFFMHHKVERLNLKVSELRNHLKDSLEPFPEMLITTSPLAGCSKDKEEDREIELVTMGHYSLRKLMNLKICRVEVT